MTNVMTMRKHLENMISEHKSHMNYAVSNNLPDMYEVCEQTIHYLSQHPAMQEGEITTDDWNNADLHTQAKSDDTEWHNPFGAPRTSQDDDFGAHKSNVL